MALELGSQLGHYDVTAFTGEGAWRLEARGVAKLPYAHAMIVQSRSGLLSGSIQPKRAGGRWAFGRASDVAAIALLALACGCSRGAPPRLIVLITIDTLRADHLAMYGYPRDTSPFLAELAAEGMVFESAYSTISTTAPAHSSIFTSLYPTQHGVTRNGKVLDEGVETLAERLGGAGYTTVAVASTDRHFLKAEVMQGFTHTNEPADVRSYRPADESVDVGIGKLAELSDVPVFLWLHLFDPHDPYFPPAETLDTFVSGGDGDELLHYLQSRQQLDLGFFPSREAALEVTNNYDAEISYADAALRRLWEATSARVAGTESVWLVTSDHPW